jgi:hypothetical protein
MLVDVLLLILFVLIFPYQIWVLSSMVSGVRF